ncbi:hypothetical protein M422DRAFT_244890, partial [Sphaerobolus stellatus SS14]
GPENWLQVSDLDFIVTEEALIATYLPRLKELGKPLWSIQADGISTKISQYQARLPKIQDSATAMEKEEKEDVEAEYSGN